MVLAFGAVGATAFGCRRAVKDDSDLDQRVPYWSSLLGKPGGQSKEGVRAKQIVHM